MLLREGEHRPARRPREDAREDVRADERRVAELPHPPLAAQQIERRAHPVVAGEVLRVGGEAVLVRRGHGEHVAQGDALDGALAALDRVVREEVEHALVDAFEEALVQRDAEQQRDHAFRDRVPMDGRGFVASVVVRLVHHRAVFQHDDAGYVVV